MSKKGAVSIREVRQILARFDRLHVRQDERTHSTMGLDSMRVLSPSMRTGTLPRWSSRETERYRSVNSYRVARDNFCRYQWTMVLSERVSALIIHTRLPSANSRRMAHLSAVGEVDPHGLVGQVLLLKSEPYPAGCCM